MSAQNQSGNAVNATTILADLPVEEQELTAAEKMQVVGGLRPSGGGGHGETEFSADAYTDCEEDKHKTGNQCDK